MPHLRDNEYVPDQFNETHLNSGTCSVEVISELSAVKHATLVTFVQQALADFVAQQTGVKQ